MKRFLLAMLFALAVQQDVYWGGVLAGRDSLWWVVGLPGSLAIGYLATRAVDPPRRSTYWDGWHDAMREKERNR